MEFSLRDENDIPPSLRGKPDALVSVLIQSFGALDEGLSEADEAWLLQRGANIATRHSLHTLCSEEDLLDPHEVHDPFADLNLNGGTHEDFSDK